MGRWVDSLVHTELAERQSRIAEIESASSPELPSLSLPASLDVTRVHSEVSSIAVAPTLSQPPRAPRGRLAMAAGLFLAGAVIALTLALLMTRDHAAPAVAAAAHPPGSAVSPASTGTVASVQVTDLPVAQPPTLPVSALPLVVPPPPTPAPRRPATPAQGSGSGSGPGAVNCDPPYWIDANGHTRYKPACL